jgi:CRP/FNR family cyclic AMP-dependent transcriptional regulator
MASEDVKLLSLVDILRPLSPEELESLARRTPVVRLERNQTIYTPGFRAEMVFLLLEGQVRVYRTVGAREFTVEVLESGKMFGEDILVAGWQRSFSAQTMQPSAIALVSRATFDWLISGHPEVGMKVIELLSERASKYAEQLAEVAFKDVQTRLASLILRLVESNGVVTPGGSRLSTGYTHRELGEMIGADRVAVTRALGKLRESGALVVIGRRILVNDEELLRRIARGY